MKLDEFESVFRSAIKEKFRYQAPELSSGLLLTDLGATESAALAERLTKLLSSREIGLEWTVLSADDLAEVGDVFAALEKHAPDMVACYRHVLSSGKGLIHSLGSVVDTLTQATTVPVLLFPSPDSGAFDNVSERAERVLVVTDHLTGDNELVSWGGYLCAEGGTLYLAHVEDDATYARYIEVIGKLPGIDTEVAAEKIREKLLSLPAEYIEGVADVLDAENIHENVVPIVEMGHALSDYKRLIDEHEIDLIVINTKDERQLAMHGMAYSLAVEIRDLPLLLL